MSSLKRLWQSPLQTNSTSGSPSGVTGGFTVPGLPINIAGSFTLPSLAAGSGYLVTNHGSATSTLWYTPSQGTAPTITGSALANSGTVQIAAGKHVLIENITAATGVTYTANGSGLTIVPGGFSYVLEIDPADSPAATVSI